MERKTDVYRLHATITPFYISMVLFGILSGSWHLKWVLEPTVPDLETAASHLILPVTLRGRTPMVGTFQLGEVRL